MKRKHFHRNWKRHEKNRNAIWLKYKKQHNYLMKDHLHHTNENPRR